MILVGRKESELRVILQAGRNGFGLAVFNTLAKPARKSSYTLHTRSDYKAFMSLRRTLNDSGPDERLGSGYTHSS